MKVAASLTLCLAASASAFAPTPVRNAGSSLTEMNALADNIFGMDLFDPSRNKYGARGKKDLKTGKLTEKSYIPTGLSKAEYEKIRAKEAAKKDANYKKNVAKAGIFEDFTKFYLKRGTSEGGSWLKSPTLGHRMAKTKFDWSNTADAKLFATKAETASNKGGKAVVKPIKKK
jgi:hypothetical protein